MLGYRSHRKLFYDLESSGLDDRENEILEVAAVLTDWEGKDILARYEQKILPTKPVDPVAARINGYTPEVWAKEGISLQQAMTRIAQLSRQAIMVAHNAPFDRGFTYVALKACGLRWLGDHRPIDTCAMAMPLLHHGLVQNLKLETLARELSVKRDEKAHSAYGDVLVLMRVYKKLLWLYGSVPTRWKKMLADRAAKELMA